MKSNIICYRKEEDKKYHVDVKDDKTYGAIFSTYKAMRNAFKRKFKLKKC